MQGMTVNRRLRLADIDREGDDLVWQIVADYPGVDRAGVQRWVITTGTTRPVIFHDVHRLSDDGSSGASTTGDVELDAALRDLIWQELVRADLARLLTTSPRRAKAAA